MFVDNNICVTSDVLTPQSLFFLTPTSARGHSFRGFAVTLRYTIHSRTPLDEWWAQSRDLYLTTHHTHKRQASMPPPGFELTIPTWERPQTHALHRAATGAAKSGPGWILWTRTKKRKYLRKTNWKYKYLQTAAYWDVGRYTNQATHCRLSMS
jgi:hypothetical protein